MFRAVAKRRRWMMHEDMQMSAIQQKFARRCAIHILRPHPPHYPTATLLLPLLPLPSLTWKGRAGGVHNVFRLCPSLSSPSPLQSALIDMENLKLFVQTLQTMQISIRHAFAEVHFFQAAQLVPTCSQKSHCCMSQRPQGLSTVKCG